MNKQQILSSILASFFAASLGACAPSNQSVVEVGEPQAMANVPKGEEPAIATIEMEAVAIEGAVLDPGALDNASMPGNGETLKRSIDEQRKRLAKAKPAQKAAETYELARLLWYMAPEGKDARKKLKEQRVEALGLLAPFAADANKASEDLLAAYAAAETAVGEPGKAAFAWDILIQKFPSSPNAARYKAMRVYFDLRARIEPSQKLPEKLEGAPYEVAYVTAWQKLRAGDNKGAVEAITVAAKGWLNYETLPSLRRDVAVIYSRGGGDPDAAWALVSELVAKDKQDMSKVGSVLADAYAIAGDLESTIKLLDKLGEGADPTRMTGVLLGKATVYYRLGKPNEAVEAITAAWKSAEAAKSAELQEAVAKQTYNIALVFHSDYVKTRDARFAEPARKLYTAYIAIPGRADADKVKAENLANLDATIKAYTEQNQTIGTLDQDLVKRRLAAYTQQVSACYEGSLSADPALAFDAKLSFKINTDGKVSDAKVEPAGDGAGAPAVGKCIAEKAAGWVFPAAGTVAMVSQPYSFKKQADKS